ncbi:hypothetical protein Q5762_10925 [Streptomyces sp. P9(2023)]|uniref:hypothetical protein n=1 Tax=Streptomyces sp. P9(2023) TaxID=3064394 RepID=UPI0028F451B2|nr:hypothetical protein [Streptomyces sp. P9(2023)]MDT9688861.1 hypothetical protein [Streptomyces sp. P9(2023)]
MAGLKYVKRTAVPPAARRPLSLLRASQLSAQHANTYRQATTNDAATLSAASRAPAPIGEEPAAARLAECFNAGGAGQGNGRIHDRFTYCLRIDIVVSYFKISKDKPPEHLGDTYGTLEVFAQGDNLQRRVRVFSRIQENSVRYDWNKPGDNIWIAPYLALGLLGQCDAKSSDLCSATGLAPQHAMGGMEQEHPMVLLGHPRQRARHARPRQDFRDPMARRVLPERSAVRGHATRDGPTHHALRLGHVLQPSACGQRAEGVRLLGGNPAPDLQP